MNVELTLKVRMSITGYFSNHLNVTFPFGLLTNPTFDTVNKSVIPGLVA